MGAGGSHAVAGWDLGRFAVLGMPGRWIRDGECGRKAKGMGQNLATQNVAYMTPSSAPGMALL